MSHTPCKFEFLKQVEGNEYYPYVPNSGNSGVTIGIGVDLGNIGVKNLDVGRTLKEILDVYDGLTGLDAALVLDAVPLRLPKEEVDLISICAIELHEKELREWFNKASNVKYDDLELAKRIVLLSVKYQYGSLPRRTPKFWGYATAGDWKSVYYELLNFGDAYPTRRKKEAKLIEPFILDRSETCLKTSLNKQTPLERKLQRLIGVVAGPRFRDGRK